MKFPSVIKLTNYRWTFYSEIIMHPLKSCNDFSIFSIKFREYLFSKVDYSRALYLCTPDDHLSSISQHKTLSLLCKHFLQCYFECVSTTEHKLQMFCSKIKNVRYTSFVINSWKHYPHVENLLQVKL